MKKKYFLFITLFVFCLLISGCSHNHIWNKATCEHPSTCIECGEIQGEAVEHMWIRKCEEKEYCASCGKEGELVEHDYTTVSCTRDKYCKKCGRIDVAALGHELTNIKILQEATCGNDGKQEGLCINCEQTIVAIIPATNDHDVEAWNITKEATTTVTGVRKGLCLICNQEIVEKIDFLTSDSDIQILKTGETEFKKLINVYNNVFAILEKGDSSCLNRIADEYKQEITEIWTTLGNTDFSQDENLEIFISNAYDASGDLLEITSLAKYNYDSDVKYAVKILNTCYERLLTAINGYTTCQIKEKSNLKFDIKDANQFEFINQSNTKLLNVEITYNIEESNGKVRFIIKTNLPDTAELMISLYGKNTNYRGQGYAIVKNGVATSEWYSKKGNALPKDNYTLSISMSVPKLQSQEVRNAVGDNGEYMTGKFVQFSDILNSNSVDFEDNITIK